MQPVDESGIRQYSNLMAEIKRRSRVIHALMSGSNSTVYLPTTIETIGLQFRKIFELIAFASLSANKKLYAATYADFAKHWQASKLINNLKRINPAGFYPIPITITPSLKPNVKSEFSRKTKGFLTPDELILAHGRCGKLMHANNPYGQEIDYEFYNRGFSDWFSKIVGLLNAHQVSLAEDTAGVFWLVQINDFSTDDVSYNLFSRVPGA
ncbi:MAG TPA: hypothetical protein VGN16_05135 [Acidobacteriaceae bacterium]|jgi:hypothetical protein